MPNYALNHNFALRCTLRRFHPLYMPDELIYILIIDKHAVLW